LSPYVQVSAAYDCGRRCSLTLGNDGIKWERREQGAGSWGIKGAFIDLGKDRRMSNAKNRQIILVSLPHGNLFLGVGIAGSLFLVVHRVGHSVIRYLNRY
jgi:hypothetical protein